MRHTPRSRHVVGKHRIPRLALYVVALVVIVLLVRLVPRSQHPAGVVQRLRSKTDASIEGYAYSNTDTAVFSSKKSQQWPPLDTSSFPQFERPQRPTKKIPKRRKVVGKWSFTFGRNWSEILDEGESLLPNIPDRRYEDPCSPSEYWREGIFSLHPPTDIEKPSIEKVLDALPDPQIDAWTSPHTIEPVEKFDTSTVPQPLKDARISADRSVKCDKMYAVVGIARGYAASRIAPYYKSFQEVRGPCTVLQPNQAYSTDFGGIVFEDYFAYVDKARELLPQFKFEQEHPEVLRLLILLLFIPKYHKVYNGFISADTRDVVFMADPFHAMVKDYEFMRKSPSYFFMGCEDIIYNPDVQFNVAWVKGLSNNAVSDMLQFDTRLKNHPQWLPVLNSGLYGGTAQAIMDMAELMLKTLMPGPNDEFGYDQGALILLGYLGLEIAKFPHRVYMLHPSASPFRDAYLSSSWPRVRTTNVTDSHGGGFARERGSENERMEFLNCAGKPYAVMHQLDRSNAWYQKVVKRFLPRTK